MCGTFKSLDSSNLKNEVNNNLSYQEYQPSKQPNSEQEQEQQSHTQTFPMKRKPEKSNHSLIDDLTTHKDINIDKVPQKKPKLSEVTE
jgi:hypothetical protein